MGEGRQLTDDQRHFVEMNADLVPLLARRLAAKGLDRDELMGIGYAALTEAALDYDPESGTAFRWWARLRIRGTMIDQARVGDPAARKLRNAQRSLERSHSVLQHLHEREHATRRANLESRIEIAEAAVAMATVMLVADGLAPDETKDESLRPDTAVERERVVERLHAALDRLPEDDRVLVQRVYFEGLSLRDYAHEIERNVSSVSRRHAKVLGQLARMMA